MRRPRTVRAAICRAFPRFPALVLGASLTIVSGCGESSGDPIVPVTPPPVPVASVDVSPATASIDVGASIALTAVPRDLGGNALSRSVTWSSSAATVATVDGSGIVRAIAPGIATITATSDGRTGTATLTVRTPPVTQLTASVQCTAELATGVLGCSGGTPASGRAAASPTSAAAPAGPVVRLLSRNGSVTNDVFSIDVAIQNLLTDQPIGTPNRTTVTGMRIVLTASPSNGVVLENPDGSAVFAGVPRQFMQYAEIVAPLQVSGFKPWRFRLNGATTFSLTLAVATEVPDANTLAPTATGALDITVQGGLLPPTGYQLIVDERGTVNIPRIPARIAISDVPVGERTVRLSNLATGCSATPNPRTVLVPAGGTGRTTFDVQCIVARAGTIVVTTTTTGADIPATYTVSAEIGGVRSIAANGTERFTGIAVGTSTVALSQVPSHCTVAGGPTRTVTIPSNQPDLTVNVAFSVQCSRAPIVATLSPTEVGDTIFRANGTVNPRGALTNYVIEVTADGQTSRVGPFAAGSDSVARPVSLLFNANVFPNTTYSYRVIATNANGTSQGLLVAATTGRGTAPRLISAAYPTSSTVGALGGRVTVLGTLTFEDTERDIVRLRYTGIQNFTSGTVEYSLLGQRQGTVPWSTIFTSCTPPQGQTSCTVSSSFSIQLEDKGLNRSNSLTFSVTVTFQ